MITMTTDHARRLLGGSVNGRDVLNGHDLLAGHASRRGTVLVTRPRRFWPRLFGGRQERERCPGRPGMRLISTGAVLLVLLGAGLLAVSYAAQYRYVLGERHHQVAASLIEAGALDVGMIIFSLIALGLALAGLASRTERSAIIGCAVASAVMNYAPAAASWRSVLAWTMPPVFLAVVVDRVVSAVRRHVAGIRDGRSPWAMAADAVVQAARLLGLVVLYALRLVLDPVGTCIGVRRAILNATPLPAVTQIEPLKTVGQGYRTGARRPRVHGGRGGTKTARFLALVAERHGGMNAIPPERVSRICAELAPEVGLDAGAARTALRKAVLAASIAGDGVR